LTTVQGLPKKFDQKKILKVIKKKFACNGTIVSDIEMGEVVQLQGDQRKDVQDFLTDKKEGLGLDAKTIKVSQNTKSDRANQELTCDIGPRFLSCDCETARLERLPRSCLQRSCFHEAHSTTAVISRMRGRSGAGVGIENGHVEFWHCHALNHRRGILPVRTIPVTRVTHDMKAVFLHSCHQSFSTVTIFLIAQRFQSRCYPNAGALIYMHIQL
jgi:hypothetical protein